MKIFIHHIWYIKIQKNSNGTKNKRKNTMAMQCQYKCNERILWPDHVKVNATKLA